VFRETSYVSVLSCQSGACSLCVSRDVVPYWDIIRLIRLGGEVVAMSVPPHMSRGLRRARNSGNAANAAALRFAGTAVQIDGQDALNRYPLGRAFTLVRRHDEAVMGLWPCLWARLMQDTIDGTREVGRSRCRDGYVDR